MQPNHGSNPYNTHTRPAPAPRKEPFFSLIASFFVPGLGTILNGETRKGVTILAVYFLGSLVSLLISLFVFSGFLLVMFLVAFGAWIWGLIDAYKGAEAHNARHGLY